jgi:hypothetical protein
MSFKVTKLTVGKGKTTGDEKAGKWERQYFELEAIIEEESALELAKGSLESLIDTWLKGETISNQEQKPTWNAEKIKWTQAEGSSGPYERSEDVNSTDFKALLKDLENHNGKFTKAGYFYWKFEKSAVVGRKKRK